MFSFNSYIKLVLLWGSIIFLPILVFSQGKPASALNENTKKETIAKETAPTVANNSSDADPKVKEEEQTEEIKKSKTPEEDFETLLKQELEGTRGQPASQEKTQVSWGWQIIKTFLVLLFLIGFFWALWKLYLFKKKLPSQESQVMQVLYQYDLSNGRQIQILELSNRLLVLGVSDSGIQLITEISDKNTIDQIKLDCEKENTNEKPEFLGELTKAIKNKFSDLSSPQKNILMNAAPSNFGNWDELRKSSKSRIQNLKKEKNFFNDLQADET